MASTAGVERRARRPARRASPPRRWPGPRCATAAAAPRRSRRAAPRATMSSTRASTRAAQLAAVDVEAQQAGGVVEAGVGPELVARLRGYGARRSVERFEGAQHAPRVVGVDGRVGRRVGAQQALAQLVGVGGRQRLEDVARARRWAARRRSGRPAPRAGTAQSRRPRPRAAPRAQRLVDRRGGRARRSARPRTRRAGRPRPRGGAAPGRAARRWAGW